MAAAMALLGKGEKRDNADFYLIVISDVRAVIGLLGTMLIWISYGMPMVNSIRSGDGLVISEACILGILMMCVSTIGSIVVLLVEPEK
jgi:hypothetical protein